MEYNIYCDESSITAKRYMLIGGLWVPWHAEDQLRDTLLHVREKHHLGAEMKWKKVSQSKLVAYKEFVNAYLCAPWVEFKCIVLDTHMINYRDFHNNDKDLGFYKFYFQIISRNLSPYNLYWLYPDDRSNRHRDSLLTLKRAVNGWWRNQGVKPNLLQAVEPRNSKKDDLLQLADILLGAIASEWNQDASSAGKLELADYIRSHIGCTSLAIATPRSRKKINIWKWEPKSSIEVGLISKRRPIP
jgi:hypothetical protein